MFKFLSKFSAQSVSDTSASSPDNFMEQCFTELVALNKKLDKDWQLSQASFSVDLDEGKIRFSLPNGKHVESSIQVIGTYDTNKGSFMWGWDHPSVPNSLQQTAMQAKKWGEEHKKPVFSTQVITVPENMAWYFTALGVKLSGAAGSYCAVSGTTQVFITLIGLKEV